MNETNKKQTWLLMKILNGFYKKPCLFLKLGDEYDNIAYPTIPGVKTDGLVLTLKNGKASIIQIKLKARRNSPVCL